MAASSVAESAIERTSPSAPGVASLIEAADAVSASLYPAESNPIDLAGLGAADVLLWAARDGADAVGCVALRLDAAGWGEIKRMFVHDHARGRGIARRLLGTLEAEARRQGLSALRLETGIHSHAAMALYRSAGFVEIGPFGSYRPDPLFVFMEKRL